jgi:hypothetical protein
VTSEQRQLIIDAWAHLACANSQSLDSDDQIIMGHVRDAVEALRKLMAVEALRKLLEQTR